MYIDYQIPYKTINNMLNFDVVYINAIPMLFENGTSTHTCV